ncbi:MAG: hypothetical protein A3C71_00180 [Candidatus Yanofskybacteria bacterium RIFCSPHIGHO2_02_FULL_43_15c]|uniref:Uncharacterized protein n=1 Tax=Candidatus Yanofskybacteria bacterium RIFCSPHIGHO2_02_FULL_43_15c TaxID=1802679 RepID=A0A1F8FFH6_9BACT|nr:MAG: hypothetical protein A3C71_00180 [Candidatus Yanofskybacteria bacterium RIFCSPHIGHO2_02_FULL_43_15c]
MQAVDSEKLEVFILIFPSSSPLSPHYSCWNRLRKRLASNPQLTEPPKAVFTTFLYDLDLPRFDLGSLKRSNLENF